MPKNTQISAQISDTTRKLMDRHVRRTGIKKGHLVERRREARSSRLYAKYGFTAFEPLEGQSEARPQTTMMWLPIQAIKNASEPTHGRLRPAGTRPRQRASFCIDRGER